MIASIKAKAELKTLVKRVSHQRHKAGVKPSAPGTWVQFNYECNPDCVRCALEKVLDRKW